MTDNKNKILEQIPAVLTEVYSDIGHPVLKPIGEILSLFPRTIKVFMSGWDRWLINREESLILLAESLESKLEKIDESNLCEPESFVAIPTIQQLCICQSSKELREMYANLLATSMTSYRKGLVHPAFVEIIRQLTLDEARLLRSLKTSLLFLRRFIEILKSFSCDGKVLSGVAIGQTALMSNAN